MEESETDDFEDSNPFTRPQGSGSAPVWEYRGPEFDPKAFFGSFWSMDEGESADRGFALLKDHLSTQNSVAVDMVTILRERAMIEEQYARSLQKLKLKADKVTEQTFGSLGNAWKRMTQECAERADTHLHTCEVLKKNICDPLQAFLENQHKEHKAIQGPIKKSFESLVKQQGVLQDVKKVAHTKSKELEAACAALDQAQQMLEGGGKKGLEAKVQELRKAKDKCEGACHKADKDHWAELCRTYSATEDWETSSILGYKAMQVQEEQRIQKTKELFTELSGNFVASLPKYEAMATGCSQANIAVDVASDIIEISTKRGSGPFVAVRPLYETCEENSKELMSTERRVNRLAVHLQHCKQELAKKHSTRPGIVRMFKAAGDMTLSENKSTDRSPENIKLTLILFDYGLCTLYATINKLRQSLAEAQVRQKPKYSLQEYVSRKPTKTGLVSAQLRLPAEFCLDVDAASNEETQASVLDAQLLPIIGRDLAVGTPSSARKESTMAAVASPASSVASANVRASAIAEDDADDFDDDDEGVLPGPPSAPPPAPKSSYPQCRALYPYTKAQDDEIDLFEGDVLDILSMEDDVWWSGKVNGREGLFPASYVERI
eukprot:m.700073 g.700073  ORF g.700073 m.700073 type:complete len:606 (+) comp58699_c0_seq2:13-1830(+)